MARKRRSLIDFINNCTEQNPNFDFYNIKHSLEVQKLHECINNSNYVKCDDNIIPHNFHSISKGKKHGIECEIDPNVVSDYENLKEELDDWNFKISKTKKNIKITSNLEKKEN